MSANIIDILNATLAAKAEAALAPLTEVETQIETAIDLAVQAAEQAVQERLAARLAALNAAPGRAVQAFEERLAEMVGRAVTEAVNRMLATEPAPAEEPAPAGYQAELERKQVLRYAEVAAANRAEAEAQEAAEEPAERDYTPHRILDQHGNVVIVTVPAPAVAVPTDDEPVAEAVPVEAAEAPATVAAQLLDAPPVGILPHETEDEPAEPDGEEEQADAATIADDVPTTGAVYDLYTRTGEGKQARYHELEGYPEPGEVYYRKVGRRWQQVRYVGS